MRTLRIGILAALALVALAARAEAKHMRFLGPHPIAAKFGGGYCYIDVPHIHAYAPDHPALYHEMPDGEYAFTGDPTPFGYDGQRYQFYGHHPIYGAPGAYCYIEGPHYHPFPPPETPEYRMQNGVAFYVGPFDPGYYKERPHRVRMVAAEYRPYVAMRPVVEVTPPPEWHGEVWVAPPAVEVSAPGVYVNTPGVTVAAPVPSVEVAAPGVYVEPPHPVVVGAPGVRVHAPGVVVGAPGVVVAPPRPVIVAPRPVVVGAPGVYVGAPRPVVVGAPGVIVEERGGGRWHHEHENDQGEWHEHHDNGKHKGWYK
jgi:hypothetical protein